LTIAVLLLTIAVNLPTLHAQGPGCDDYPLFCVPRVGYTGLALHRGVPLSHPLARPSGPIAPGVVRGMTQEGSFFLGDPTAPIHFLIFHSFTCSHCAGYYKIELLRFIEDYVLSGQAALHVRILSFSMQPYADNAALAAICAGEQGAFWEMQHELFLRGSADGPPTAFDLDAIATTAADLGLDSGRLRACVETGRYRFLLDSYWTSALDAGVSATPTILYRQDATQPWQKTMRNYENLAQLTQDSK
jgi:protein-disulfide isomerase